MPFDVIKTRMQSLSAKQEYKNLFHCGWRIVKEEGVATLWKGSVPRLARLSVSFALLLSSLALPFSVDEKLIAYSRCRCLAVSCSTSTSRLLPSSRPATRAPEVVLGAESGRAEANPSEGRIGPGTLTLLHHRTRPAAVNFPHSTSSGALARPDPCNLRRPSGTLSSSTCPCPISNIEECCCSPC